MTAGLKPLIELAMVHQQYLFPIRADNPGRAGDVHRRLTIKYLLVLVNEFNGAPDKGFLFHEAASVAGQQIEEFLAMHG